MSESKGLLSLAVQTHTISFLTTFFIAVCNTVQTINFCSGIYFSFFKQRGLIQAGKTLGAWQSVKCPSSPRQTARLLRAPLLRWARTVPS